MQDLLVEAEGAVVTRHRERPSRRVNPSNKVVWMARYTGRDGKRRSAGTFELKRDAQDAINAAYEAEERGPVSGVTIRGYAERWLDRHPRSARTNATNEHRLQQLIGPFTAEQIAREERDRLKPKHRPRKGVEVEGVPLGDWRLVDFRRRHALEVLNTLLVDQGRAALGAKRVLDALSAMYTDALRDELVEANPVIGVKARASDPRIRKQSREPRILTIPEMHGLAAAAGDNEPMIRLVSDCGLRLGELLGLAAEDVKLGPCDELDCPAKAAHLHVRRTAHKGVVSIGTKRERLRDRISGGRVVPLPAPTIALLRAMPRRIAGPMFFTERGTVWWEENFRRDIWSPASKASGVAASPQDFRHSWISECRAAGIDPADLAMFAGHSLVVGSAVYTHALGRSWDAVAGMVGT
jgi:integrase